MEGGGSPGGEADRSGSESAHTQPEIRRSKRVRARAGPSGQRSKSPAASASTKKTTSSVTRALEAELQAKRDSAELEERVDTANREIELLEHSVKALIDQLEEAKGRDDVPPEDQDAWKKEMKILEKEIRQKSNDIAERRIKIKYLGKYVAREKDLIEQQLEVDRLLLEEDDNSSQDLSGEEIPSDGEDYLSAFNIGHARSVSPETKKMIEDLSKPLGNEKRPTTSVQPPTSEVKIVEPKDTNQSTVSSLAAALTEAFKTAGVGAQREAKSEKFFARQTIKQDLPVFDGNPEEWPIFVSQFRTVSKECGLSPVENLQRLQRALKGEARECVRALLLSPENVEKIVEVLTKRYGDPEVVVQRLLRQAQQLLPVKESDYGGILKFSDVVRNLAATAESMHCAPFLTNPQLMTELVGKLPVTLQVDWTKEKRRLEKSFADVKDFAVWLEDLSEVYIKLHQPSTQRKTVVNNYPQRSKTNNVMVAAEDRSSKKNSGGNRDKKCLFCKTGDHFIAACGKFKALGLEERWKWMREKNHCFSCLNFGHGVGKCYTKKECQVDGCTRMHHAILHKYEEQTETEKTDTLTHASIPVNSSDQNYVNLMILPVVLRGPAGEVKTFAMLDTGSTVTLLEDNLAEELGLEGVARELTFKGLHPTVNHHESRMVDFKVRGQKEAGVFQVNGARTIGNLPLPYQSLRRKTLNKWKHLRNLKIDTFEGGRPRILIGQDNVDLILARKVINGPPQAPVAVLTKLGWTLCGKVNHHMQGDWTYHIQEGNKLEELHQLVKHHLSLDSMGVKVSSESHRCKEDKRAQSIMDTTIKRVEGGWEAGLLWKSEEVKMPDSKRAAMIRLQQMERRMDRDPEFRETYHRKIDEYTKKGFARKLTKEELSMKSSKEFYLSHFLAINPKKPKKRRFVLDAAAKVEGESFNDKLLKGPDQLTNLPGILMKFREKAIGIMADIQDMFHRVKLIPEDRPAQRFLWRGDRREGEPDVYEIGTLFFGASCSPSIAQEVKNRNALEFKDIHPVASAIAIILFYVDDFVCSCDTVEEAIELQKTLRSMFMQGGFNLCNWVSSSKEVMKAILEELRAVGHRNLDMEDTMNMERVLGLFWLPEEDQFTFSLNFVKSREEFLTGKRLPTKREFLAMLMTIYDPLGFVAHFTVKAKILLQSTWKSQIGWDDDIPACIALPFKQWVTELQKITEFKVPRCYSRKFSTAENIELHIFCDASEEAFGAVAYFRIKTNEGTEVKFISAKSRVAPLKALSIPRLELQAAVIGTRLGQFIKESHTVKIKRTVYWSDSRTVLCWLQSEGKRYQAFVSHRVGEIQEATEPGEWRWIPTGENVADELTRADKPAEFGNQSRWICGPSFLKLEEEKWPQIACRLKPVDADCDLELKREYVGTVVEVRPLLEVEKFSSWNKLVRTTGQVLRFISLISKKGSNRYLVPVEIQEGEKYWWRIMQQQSFAEEIQCVKNNKPLPSTSRLKSFCLLVDEDGVLRLRGRLEKAKEVPYEARYPVVLDNKNHLTQLLIQHHHVRGNHHGMERVVNELRQQFFILNIRSAVRSAWNSCQLCKNRRAAPAVPEMAVLPPQRLEGGVSPFNNCGVDYFGPMEVTDGRHHEKRYGVLFTCLSTRAVHLEIAHSLSTDSCIMALRRFFSRRGCPKVLWSDNGTNFRGAATELKKCLEELNQNKLREECCSKGVVWKFIPPAAPHMGGSWERLVKSVKIAIQAILRERYPSDEVLGTLMVEAEHVVNSRPLTHVSIDPEDPEAITPNHFLLGRSSNVRSPGVFDEDDLCLRKQWKKAQQLTEMFWFRWRKEYLPTLLNRSKWTKTVDPLKIGDVVLEVDYNNPRNCWPMGVVEKVFPGSDGQVRVAEVRFRSGVLRRPVAKLAKLEVERREDGGFRVGEDAAASTRAGDCRRLTSTQSSSDEFERAAGGKKGRVHGEEERKKGE